MTDRIAPSSPRVPGRNVGPRLPPGRRGPIAAALAVTAILAGASTVAATGWVPIFATRSVAPIALEPTELVTLPDLTAYGEVQVDGDLAARVVADASAAAEATGLSLTLPHELPRGVTGDPTYRVVGPLAATLTLADPPTAPAGLAGARLRLEAGPAVAAVWTGASGIPALVVARAVAPTATTTGASFEAIRDHLVTTADLPDDIADALRTFEPGRGALPLPLPTDRLTSSPIDLDGTPATLVVSDDGTMAAVLVVDAGIATLVAGSLTADEVLTTAGPLR